QVMPDHVDFPTCQRLLDALRDHVPACEVICPCDIGEHGMGRKTVGDVGSLLLVPCAGEAGHEAVKLASVDSGSDHGLLVVFSPIVSDYGRWHIVCSGRSRLYGRTGCV